MFVINLDLERSLLKSLFQDPEALPDVMSILSTSDVHFYDQYNKAFYQVIVSFYLENKPFIEQKFIEELSSKIGKDNAIVEFSKIMSANSTAYVVDTAQMILEQSIKKQIDILAANIDKDLKSYAKYTDILANIDNHLNNIYDNNIAINVKSIKNITDNLKHTVSFTGGVINNKFISTGYIEFDDTLRGGFLPGQFSLIAARPSMGKTAFMTNLALNIARKDNPVAIFSLEMTQDELVLRMLNQYAGKLLYTNNQKVINIDEFNYYIDALSNLPIYIDDSPRLDVVTIKTKLRKLVRMYDVKIAFIDYLQLISVKQQQNREREVSEISRSLKLLAKDVNIPIICLAQLNRAVELRNVKKPLLSDLRESGSLEQDADLVVFIHRDKYYNRDANDNMAEIIVAKNRIVGIVKSFKLDFVDSIASFDNPSFAKTSYYDNDNDNDDTTVDNFDLF